MVHYHTETSSGISLGHEVWLHLLSSLSQCCFTGFQHWSGFACKCIWLECCTVGCFISWESLSITHFQMTCSKTHTQYICYRYRCSFSLQNAMIASILMITFAVSYRCWHVLFHIHSLFYDVSFLCGSHNSTGVGENFPKQFIMLKKDCSSFYK